MTVFSHVYLPVLEMDRGRLESARCFGDVVDERMHLGGVVVGKHQLTQASLGKRQREECMTSWP